MGPPARLGGGQAVIKVYDLGHARAGDKGNISNVSVTAYDERAWNILREQLKTQELYQDAAAKAAKFIGDFALKREQAATTVCTAPLQIIRSSGSSARRTITESRLRMKS